MIQIKIWIEKMWFGEDLFIILKSEKRIIGTFMGANDGHPGVMNYLAIRHEFCEMVLERCW